MISENRDIWKSIVNLRLEIGFMVCGTREDSKGSVESKVDLDDIQDLVKQIKDLNQNW